MSEAAVKDYKIAYSCMSLDNAYFVEICNGARERAAELGIEVLIHDGNLDVNRQINAIETWIQQGVDAICITPVDPVALEPYVKQAQDAGIPVIGCNQPIVGTDAFVTIEEHFYGYICGKLVAEYIDKYLTDLKEVKIVLYTWPMIEVLMQRTAGFKDAIQQYAPKAVIIAEPNANTAAHGMATIEAVMQAHDSFHIVHANDAVGVAIGEAIVAAGREKGVAIIGMDCTMEAIEKIRERGIYYGTVDIMPFQSGKLYIDTAIRVIEEGPIPELIPFDYRFVTWENVDEAFPK